MQDKNFSSSSTPTTLVSEAWNIHHESREAEEEQVMFDSDGILGQHYQDRRVLYISCILDLLVPNDSSRAVTTRLPPMFSS